MLDCPRADTEGDYPILRGQVEAAVQSLKTGRSAEVGSIPAELVQAGGEGVVAALATVCGRVWQTGEWPTPWTQSLVITLPRRGSLRRCQNCRPVGLIGQRDLCHVFTDARRAFDRVWHAARWVAVRECSIGAGLVRVVDDLCDRATDAVLFGGGMGDLFRTTVGVQQGCLLSPILFNIFLERTMTDALEDHENTVSIGGRTITNLRFVDDIDGLAGEKEELAKLVECLDKVSTAYGMEISAEKTKLI